MNSHLEKVIDEINISKKGDIELMYLYGSYVNGYYEKDSDIDLVVVSKKPESKRPINRYPNISIHHITPWGLNIFETARSYAHLRMVPITNPELCNKLSDEIKSELVRRELMKFKRLGISDLEVMDPINNFLLNYAIERPWRVKPIKRIFRSEKAQEILKQEYLRIFSLLETRKMLVKTGEMRYSINPNHVFDYDGQEVALREGFGFKMKNSYFGWHYLANLKDLVKFSMKAAR